jgi:hypothetical protein
MALLSLENRTDWIHRRIEQLEFLDGRTVSWRVSVDFIVPRDAPTVSVGIEPMRLVPITAVSKSSPPLISIGHGIASQVWIPVSEETNSRLSSALIWRASSICSSRGLPTWTARNLQRVVFAKQSELQEAIGPFAAAANLIDAKRAYRRSFREYTNVEETTRRIPAWQLGSWLAAIYRRRRAKAHMNANRRGLSKAKRSGSVLHSSTRPIANQLMADWAFRDQMMELAQNAVIVVGVPGPPGARQILDYTYETTVVGTSMRSNWMLLFQYLGWRSWPLMVFTGGHGHSQHIQISTPPGADIIGVTGNPVHQSATCNPVKVAGGTPHISLELPADCGRYLITVFLKISRRGWLASAWLVSLVIAVLIGFFRVNLAAFTGQQSGNTALLLTTVIGVFVTTLVGSREHPLVSRLLSPLRLLIALDLGVVFVAGISILASIVRRPLPTQLWSVLAAIAGVIAVLLTISLIFPIMRRAPYKD